MGHIVGSCDCATAGADPDAQTRSGQTPAEVAKGQDGSYARERVPIYENVCVLFEPRRFDERSKQKREPMSPMSPMSLPRRRRLVSWPCYGEEPDEHTLPVACSVMQRETRKKLATLAAQ